MICVPWREVTAAGQLRAPFNPPSVAPAGLIEPGELGSAGGRELSPLGSPLRGHEVSVALGGGSEQPADPEVGGGGREAALIA